MTTGKTTENIRELARRAPEGAVLTAKGLLHLGSRAAVDQALSRLAKSGELERIGRGLYVRPIETRFGKKFPELALVLAELSRRTGETIVPSGAAAANRLGLTTQVPIRQVFLTSGRSRRLQLGSQSIELRHTAPKYLVMPKRPAGDALRAMTRWARPTRLRRVLEQLRVKLPKDELERLLEHRSLLPTPAAQALSELAPRG